MSDHQASVNFCVFRVFTFRVDGKPHSKAFPHGTGDPHTDQSMQFHRWLDEGWPGMFAAGRVSRIEFVDELRNP